MPSPVNCVEPGLVRLILARLRRSQKHNATKRKVDGAGAGIESSYNYLFLIVIFSSILPLYRHKYRQILA